MDAYKKIAVEKYLEQVKVLTALSTTLLLSPNIALSLRTTDKDTGTSIFEQLPGIKPYFYACNISFLISILMTYFIYSTIVGYLDDGVIDLYRPSTRVYSIIQFVGTVTGAICLLIFFIKLA